METKKWYKSKTIWTGIVTGLIAIYNVSIPIAQTHFNVQLPPIPEYIFILLGTLGVYNRKVAKTEIK